MGIPDHLACLLRNLYAGQEGTVRTRHGTTDWFKIWKPQQWPQDWKRSVFIPIPKKGNAKACSKTVQLSSFHMLARLCSKSFSSMWTENFQLSKLGFKEAGKPEIKVSTFIGSWRKQGSSRKTSASLTTQQPLTLWITINCGKFLRDGNTRPPCLSPEKPVCRSRRNS